MTFEQYTARRDELQCQLDAASAALKSLGAGTGRLGLTPDNIKAGVDYQTARRDCALAFDKLRALNGQYVKRFAVELRAERETKRAALLAMNEGN